MELLYEAKFYIEDGRKNDFYRFNFYNEIKIGYTYNFLIEKD